MIGARSLGEWAVAALWFATFAASAACGDAAKPAGNGDHLFVDVDASTGEQPPMVDAASDSIIGTYIDANALPSACNTCACDTTTQFCFGGGPSAQFSGTCDQTGGPLAVGCNLIPSACLNE